ncbi:MAG: SUF system Fe-S cluster assembly regulator [Alphaproteobacteria bacterium]
MFRLSKMTDYAVIVLALMSKEHGAIFTAPDISVKTSLPQPAVAKLLKALARAQVIQSKRGAQGGYILERRPHNITIAEVIVAMDGPVSLTACVDNSEDQCHAASLCPMSGRWQVLNNAVEQAIISVSLAQIITPFYDQTEILTKQNLEETL